MTPTLDPTQIASLIDHTFLKAFGPPADIEVLCREAAEYRFATAVVHPFEIARCRRLLEGSPVRACAVIGFPLGQNTSETKAFETNDAIAKGAQELDTVINVRALEAGDVSLVGEELKTFGRLCRDAGVISKVILETCYLSDDQKRTVCELSLEAGLDFVKTSTGLGTGGATVEDVRLMAEVGGGRIGVKASGGVRNLATLLEMVDAGATRIGTSSGVQIMAELRGQS